MSRLTDTERGARLAVEIAGQALFPPPLFPDLKPTPEQSAFWRSVLEAADYQLAECEALRLAQLGVGEAHDDLPLEPQAPPADPFFPSPPTSRLTGSSVTVAGQGSAQ